MKIFKYWNPIQTKKTSNFVVTTLALRNNRQHRKSFLLFYILFGYVMAQICWWIFQIILLSRQLDGSGEMVQNKVKMLAGEFAVFFAIIAGGMFYITRVFRRELKLAQNKKNFSLSITHELKTPITTTKLLLETLQSRKLSEEKTNEIYTKINDEQTRLHSLIDKVLLSEKIGNSDFKISPHKVNFSNFLIDEIQKILVPQNIESNIQPNVFLQIDEFYFTSVVSNLIENAAKYSLPETTIEISLQAKDDELVLQIIDEGIGIPDEEKIKVFDVYYRLGNEEIRNTAGTGLGLYLVKKIVQLHRGTIKVKNNESKKGSCFEVKLPYKNI